MLRQKILERNKNCFFSQFLLIFQMCEFVLPEIVKQDRGIIVTVSSIQGWRPIPHQSTYSASKVCRNLGHPYSQWRSQRGGGHGGRIDWVFASNPGGAPSQTPCRRGAGSGAESQRGSGAEPPATFLRRSRPGVCGGAPTAAAPPPPCPPPPLAMPLTIKQQVSIHAQFFAFHVPSPVPE